MITVRNTILNVLYSHSRYSKGMISTNELKECLISLHKIFSWDRLKSVKWMNQRALPKQSYNPTTVEHFADIVTHGVWVVPSILGTLELVKRSHNGAQLVSALLYGATLIFIFCVSTSFHCVFYCNKHRQLKDVLHRCDRAMIYIFIAGSYFPWLTIESLPTEGWASSMKWFIWLLAALGIIYQQTFHERYKHLETVFYIIMGVGPALPIISEHDLTGFREVLIGGTIYITGLFFFKSDGIIPCAHAIWHLFVVMAAGTHYYAILNYLYPEQITSEF